MTAHSTKNLKPYEIKELEIKELETKKRKLVEEGIISIIKEFGPITGNYFCNYFNDGEPPFPYFSGYFFDDEIFWDEEDGELCLDEVPCEFLTMVQKLHNITPEEFKKEFDSCGVLPEKFNNCFAPLSIVEYFFDLLSEYHPAFRDNCSFSAELDNEGKLVIHSHYISH